MNNLKLLALALSLCSQINTYCDIYYNSPLSLVLLKDGVRTFLNESKRLPEHEFREAIQDVIALADQNNTNIQRLLHELETDLIHRIKCIESVKGKFFEYSILATGITISLFSAALGYGAYIIYKKWYAPGTVEFNAIVEELEKRGVKVTNGHNITLHIPFYNICSYAQSKGERLLEIRKLQEDLNPVLFVGSALSFISFLAGFCCTFVGLYPHLDDEFLDIYKSQLAWIQELHKSTIDKNLENLKRDFINVNY